MIYLRIVIVKTKGPTVKWQSMSQSDTELEGSIDNNTGGAATDFEWDYLTEVPSFFNCSNLSEEEFNSDPYTPTSTRGQFNSSTEGHFLDGVSVLGAYYPIPTLRSPGVNDISLEVNSSLLSTSHPPRVFDSVEEYIEDFQDCEDLEDVIMPTKPTPEQMREDFTRKVASFNRHAGMIDKDHEGLMDGRAEQKLQTLADEVENLWDNLEGKFPEENVSMEESLTTLLSKMHRLRLTREKHLVPASDDVVEPPKEQPQKCQYDILKAKCEYWSAVVEKIKNRIDETILSTPDGSQLDVSQVVVQLQKLQDVERTTDDLFMELTMEISIMGADVQQSKKEEIAKISTNFEKLLRETYRKGQKYKSDFEASNTVQTTSAIMFIV